MAITFVSLVLMEFSKAYHFRSDRDSVLKGLFSNRWLNLAILWELLLLGPGASAPLEDVRLFTNTGQFNLGVSMVYAMIHRMDSGVARILGALERQADRAGERHLSLPMPKCLK